jgi:hypothetical protein
MQTATHHSPEVREAVSTVPADFVPLHLETRTHVSTAVLCRHLSRKEQTARGWASAGTHPAELRPLRVHGRLAWPVAGIRAVLGVQA